MSNVPPPPPPPGYQPYGQRPPYGYQQPYGYPQPYGYQAPYFGEKAGFWSRFLGLFIDGLIALVAYVPAAVLFILSFAAGHDELCDNSFRGENFRTCRQPNVALLLLAFLVLALGVVGYYAFLCLRLGRTGQTPGCKAANIKVIDNTTGRPIGAGKALGRYAFAGFISGQVCYLGYLWMLWDADKQTWHDKVVSSIVVKT